MQYDEIIDRVAEYVDRTDLGTSSSTTVSSTKIGKWVNDTRKDLALKYSFNYLYTEATISTSAATSVYALPQDYMGHLSLMCAYRKLVRVGAREFEEMYYIDDELDDWPAKLELKGTSEATSGMPEYYIDRGMYFQLFPTPDAAYTITLKYYAQPADFTTNSDEDYMSRFNFEAIIFGAGLRAAIFLDDQAKIPIFAAAYDKSIKELVDKEKETKLKDMKPRVHTWKDYDLIAFRQLMRAKNT